MSLSYVPVEQIGATWPKVRPFIQRANDKLGERASPEEFYYALRQNMAALYLIADKGIVIAQKVVELDGSVTLFVWLIAGDLSPHAEDVLARLEEMAARMGAKRLRMRSPRRWDRALHGYWQPAETLYEHKLETKHDVAA